MTTHTLADALVAPTADDSVAAYARVPRDRAVHAPTNADEVVAHTTDVVTAPTQVTGDRAAHAPTSADEVVANAADNLVTPRATAATASGACTDDEVVTTPTRVTLDLTSLKAAP